MTLDPAATYRRTQVLTGSRLDQVVLLYQGAIRQGMLHLSALENRDLQAAHRASLKCQEIVSALQESLDMSAGPIAAQLDQLYRFVLDRLIDGNITKDPKPTAEALQVLRDLLPAWQAIAHQPGNEPAGAPVAPRPMAAGAVPAGLR